MSKPYVSIQAIAIVSFIVAILVFGAKEAKPDDSHPARNTTSYVVYYT